jgi:DNA-binding SARP family transcriptional activator
MCAFATVHNVESLEQLFSKKLTQKLAKVETDQQRIDALYAHIADLMAYIERSDQMHFRVVNLMSKKELNAYDMIADKLKPNASNTEWLIEIREWQKNNP